jgi:glyoxylate reductase
VTRVFVTRALPEGPLEALAAEAGLEVDVSLHDRPATRQELQAGLAEAEVLVSQLLDPIDAELIAAAPKLRLICNYAVGINNVDLEAAAARGITVCNTPDVLTEASADLTWALILSVTRHVLEGDRMTRAGEFKGWAPQLLLGTELYGKTLGIVGLGRIGKAVARRARGFGLQVCYTGRSEKPADESEGARYVSLAELLRSSDLVCLHCPLTPETRHLLDAERLSWLKPSAYLINMARGPVVDEAALVAALREGRLAGAGLDVYEREPALEPGLAELDSVVLLPHLGSATRETRLAMAQIVADNIADLLAGRPPRTRVG